MFFTEVLEVRRNDLRLFPREPGPGVNNLVTKSNNKYRELLLGLTESC